MPCSHQEVDTDQLREIHAEFLRVRNAATPRGSREARAIRHNAADQLVVGALLAEPEPYLTWLLCTPSDYRHRRPADYVNALGNRVGVQFDLFGSGNSWLGLPALLREPLWLARMGAVREGLATSWQYPIADGTDVIAPRWALWWNGSDEEILTVYYVTAGGAPPEDYQIGYWKGDPYHGDPEEYPEPDMGQYVEHSPLAAEFVFRGGPYDLHAESRDNRVAGSNPSDATPLPAERVDLSAAVAHGVWYRREHTWCDTPVGGSDSPSCFSRTARGFLRLPNRCPECERFYRAQIDSPGGLRAFAVLQRLDLPDGPPVRQSDLTLLDDRDVMIGDKPLPPPPDEYHFPDSEDE